jgi:ATP-dependent DNA helicase RecG
MGVPVEALGKTTSHLRNSHLVEILRSVRTIDGQRVVERLGSGIPTVLAALAEAGMQPPAFHDMAVRFTVRVSNKRRQPAPAFPVAAPVASSPVAAPAPADLTAKQSAIWSAIAQAPHPQAATIVAIAEATTMSAAQVRRAIADLDKRGLISRAPLDGRTLTYRVRHP